MSHSLLTSLIQRFFTDRLFAQLGASSYTVAAYRDGFRLLFQFAAKTLRRAPSNFRLENLDVSKRPKWTRRQESD